ncbi:hypothetical protein KUCAC02_030664, partial [Chaenocephalus aceratus]
EVDTKRINVPSGVPSGVPSDSEGDESPIENPNTLSISAPPTPASSNNRLKENNTLQQLKEDLQQLKSHNEALASDLRGRVEALKQEDSVLRVQSPRLSLPVSLAHPLCSAPSPTTPRPLLIHPHSQLPTQPPSTQPEEQDPQVVLLADSNGKFLDPRKLFPDEKVLSKHCSTTGQRPYRPSQTASSPSPPQDHHPYCEETQQLSLDLPLPTPPTHPEEATFTQLTPCTTSAAEICSNSCSSSPSPPTAAELCCSCSPACCTLPPPAATLPPPATTLPPPATSELGDIRMMLHPPSPCYL